MKIPDELVHGIEGYEYGTQSRYEYRPVRRPFGVMEVLAG